MKNIIAILLALITVSLSNCKQEQANLNDIQAKLAASPLMRHGNNLFSEYTIYLGAISPEELKVIQSTLKAFGYSGSNAPIELLESVLDSIPKGHFYIKSQKSIRAFRENEKQLILEIPELKTLSSIQRKALLIPNFNESTSAELFSKISNLKK